MNGWTDRNFDNPESVKQSSGGQESRQKTTECRPGRNPDKTKELYINYQLDAQIIIYSYNITFLYMFRDINAHLQEVTLYTCSIWYRHSLREVVVAGRRIFVLIN